MLITLARKPLEGNVANNCLQHGTGALNIDATRIGGRWPANVLIVPSPEVLQAFPEVKGQVGMAKVQGGHRFIEGDTTTTQKFAQGSTDSGSASRFFKQIQGD